MTIKEELLMVKTYQEFFQRKDYFVKHNLDLLNPEVKAHIIYLEKKYRKETDSTPDVWEKDGIVYELPHDKYGNWPPKLERL